MLKRQAHSALVSSLVVLVLGPGARVDAVAGAHLYKSGPIQITADGKFVWLVNPDHDSVSRIDTKTRKAEQFFLPDIAEPHNPQGLAVSPDGSEVWVAAHDSDRVYVLDGEDGTVLKEFKLRHGGGPISIAISPLGDTALVALHRSAEIAVFDVWSRSLRTVISGLYQRPLGIAFTSRPNEAWVSHNILDGEDSHLSRLDLAVLKVADQVIMKSTEPKDPEQISGDADPIPEGGYLLFRGHFAERPNSGTLWIPTQYQNFHNSKFTPDSTINAAIHYVDLAGRRQVDPDDRVVLSAVWAHNNNSKLLGRGWDAGISGLIDVAFSADGKTAYLPGASSNDVVVVPADITMHKPKNADPLTEIPVGDNPIGIVVSPTDNMAYVHNYLSRDVSVIDLETRVEIMRIPATPGTPEPRSAMNLRGARIFNSSDDPRISSNGKVSCASCHPNGENDGTTWELGQLGAGHRKTLRLRGLGLSFGPKREGRGQLHRAGDRDEVQDFEFSFRLPIMGGTGFLLVPSPPLGLSNAGLSPELDAMAKYVLDLPALYKSPHRAADGALTEAAIRGGAIFKNTAGGRYDVGCIACHTPPRFADLRFHDVGGFVQSPEHQGPPFNTPSLVGAWDSGIIMQGAGDGIDNFTIGGLVRRAKGRHGDTRGLTARQKRDLEAFLMSIDGQMVESGIESIVDREPPRVLAVRPVQLGVVEVIFNETVDPRTANNPANYTFSNGTREYAATDAVVNPAAGNRVRVRAPLVYYGCDVIYALTPGPIEDVAGEVAGGTNNVLDVNDPGNRKSFLIDGTITVTFGDTGRETFPSVATDAGMIAGLTTWSHSRWILNPTANPEMKGFVSFDFVPTLRDVCGVENAAEILSASFSAMPFLGHQNDIELRRCFMPWGAPPRDWCRDCNGAVTVQYSTYPSIRWRRDGAQAVGGTGDDPGEYYPGGAFDVAATVDATGEVRAVNERTAFAGARIDDAFRFWFEHPQANYGYAVDIAGTSRLSTEFWSDEQEGGKNSFVLSITLAVPRSPGDRPGDLDCDGSVDLADVEPFIIGLLDPLEYRLRYPDCDVDLADLNGDGSVDLVDMEPFVELLLRGC